MERFIKYKLTDSGLPPDSQFEDNVGMFGYGPDEDGFFYGTLFDFEGDLPDLTDWQAQEITKEQLLDTPYEHLILEKRLEDQLWQSATSYQTDVAKFDANSAAAITSLVVLAKMTDQPAPKAKALVVWWQGLWADYNQRRDAIRAGDTNPNFDFSNHGKIPYSVSEAQAEVTVELD